MPIKSLDPRVTRENISESNEKLDGGLKELDHWQTYEVFSQSKKGDRHTHAGSLHAPNTEMAYILAKEQFGRRNKCVSIWVVKTEDVFTLDSNEEQLYERNSEKIYREAGGYKVMEKINAFKKANVK